MALILKHKAPTFICSILLLLTLFFVVPQLASAAVLVDCPDGTSVTLPTGKTYAQVCATHMGAPASPGPATPPGVKGGNVCGGGIDSNGNTQSSVNTSINIGCKGKGNPIADVLFAIIRVLSDGVGLVIVGSIVYGGIQYSASRGDPQAAAQAITRLRSTLVALLIFIFGYAILNYIIPTGFLK